VSSRTLTVRVERITRWTGEISAFELVHPWGGRLPAFEPGAHIDVHTPGGFTRQYSLAQAPEAPGALQRYVIGVKREGAGRGGSAALHDRIRAGDLLAISTPRNGFGLHGDATHHLLLAGGIGITPLLAMAQQLARRGAGFSLCVFARSRSHLAFADALSALAPQVRLHFDDAAAADRIDLRALLASHRPGEHLYLCGPAGFMKAALGAAAHWPEDTVHLEHFAPPDAGSGAVATGTAFEMRLARRGIAVTVGAGQTAVEALHDIGIVVPTSCEQGLCGTCVVGWQADAGGGEPEHRDFCLPPAERRHKVALCCARARGGVLVLDL
jgi:vanillate O-demethylase ferredoxin subunit